MKSQKLDMDKIIRNSEMKIQQEIVDLESISKQLYELIVTENFTIDEVIAESYTTSFSPNSEMRLGGRYPVYSGGFTSKLFLKVSPDNKDVPIRTLNFDGLSIVRAGDYISAQIPRYKEKRFGSRRYLRPFESDKVFYFDRDFNLEESAIELVLLSKDGSSLRIDRSINYKHFKG